MLTLHPPAFIETEDCDGPRYTRGQPSRENPGVLMSDIQNKYITEFELPYRNIERYIKEVGNNWNRLDDNQKNKIRKSFQGMGLIESFGNDTTPPINEVPPVENGSISLLNPTVGNFIKFLNSSPTNTALFMDTLWHTTPEQMSQMGLTSVELANLRDLVYEWSVDNAYIMHSNWRSGSILFFFLIVIFILIIVAATTGNNSTEGKSFGRSLFGRH